MEQPVSGEGLEQWWRRTSEADLEQTAAKAREYGSEDLWEIGRTLGRISGRAFGTDPVELAIFFYLQGKVARWADAIRRGDLASDDTLADIEIYAKMARRNRAAGGWPGEDEEEEL